MFSLILVDFNSLPKTIQYIDRCTKAFGSEGVSHIVIIQNGDASKDIPMMMSSFGTYTSFLCSAVGKEVLVFHSEGREILYCASGENLGYGRGNNLGVKIAEEVWADAYYIVSNNDLEFPYGFDLQVITDLFESDSKIGAIGPQIITPEGVQQSPRNFESAFQRLIRRYWWPLFSRAFGAAAEERARTRIFEDGNGKTVNGTCDWISGCLTFLRASAFGQAGMYDENTFLYGEEMILSKRLERVGFSVYFCADIIVVHDHGTTIKKAIDSWSMMRIDFNSVYYFYENYTDASKLMLWTAKFSFWLLVTLCNIKATLKKILKSIKKT